MSLVGAPRNIRVPLGSVSSSKHHCLLPTFPARVKYNVTSTFHKCVHRNWGPNASNGMALAAYEATVSALEDECKTHNAAVLAAFAATIPTGTVWAVAPMPTKAPPSILFFALYPPKQHAVSGSSPYDNMTCRAIARELQHDCFLFVDMLPLAPVIGADDASARLLYAIHNNASGVQDKEVARVLNIRRSVHSKSLSSNAIRRLLAAVAYVRAVSATYPLVALCGEVVAKHWRKSPAVKQCRLELCEQVSVWEDVTLRAPFLVVHITHPSAQWHGRNRENGKAVFAADMQLADALSAIPATVPLVHLPAAVAAAHPVQYFTAAMSAALGPVVETWPPRLAEVHFYKAASQVACKQVADVLGGMDAPMEHVLCGRLNARGFADDIMHWVYALGEAAAPALKTAAFAEACVRYPQTAVAQALAWTGTCGLRLKAVGSMALALMLPDVLAWTEEFIAAHGVERACTAFANPVLGSQLARRRHFHRIVDAWTAHHGAWDALNYPEFVANMHREPFMRKAIEWAAQGRRYSELVAVAPVNNP